ncbi:MAG TPA: hypothetical protein VJT13_01195, partial [Xanthobacteraceae bacterium]|nr:hypothetical protein [Xanthobacteraceae bacterium]
MARNVTLQRVAPSPANNSSNGAFAGGVFTPTADNAIADIDQVETLLNAGTSVDIRTIDATGTQAGDIIVAGNETITKTGTGIATLRLNAEDDIFIDGGVTIQQSGGTLGTDKLNIVVNADSDASTTSRGGIYLGFAVAASVTLSTNGGNISFGGRDTTLAGTVGDATTFATGSGTGSVSSTGIFIRSSTLNSGGGAISMAGHGFAGGLASRGIIIQEGSDINAAGGAITLIGVGGAGQFDCYGVLIGSAAATQVRTTGTGTITITGTGGDSTGNDDHGVLISAQAVVSAVNGAITITGKAGAGGGVGQGIRLTDDASIISTGGGAISLTGTGAGSGPGSEGIALNVDSIGNSLPPGGTVTIGGASASGFISLKSLSGSDVAIGGASGSATIQTTGSVLVEAQGGGIITLASGSHIIGGITGVTLRADDIALADTVSVGNGGGTAGLTSHTASREIDVGTDTAGKLGITDAELDLLNAGAIIIGDGAHTGAITVSADINPATAQNIRLWNNTGGIALGANVTVTQSLEIRADLNGTTGAITHTAGTLTAQQMVLSAATGIGSAGGAGAVFTSALTLDAQNTGATGNINIVESNGLTLGALKQTGAANTLGTVALTSTTGNIGLNNGSVLSQGGLITLTAAAGAITDADGGTAASIINTGGAATLTAAIGIGNAADRLEVQVGTLRA